MNASTRTRWALLGTLWLASHSAFAGKAHEHGVVKLDVAVDGATLNIEMRTPLDSLLGFERAPRTDAERKAAAAVLAQLRAPGTLFVADAAAGCSLSKAEVVAPVLEAGAKPADGHADLDASYVYTCTQPQELRTLQLGLFEAYKRMRRIDVQTAGPQGQGKATLRRPANSVTLRR